MGRFAAGQTKPLGSGRKRGTSNKSTRTLLDALDSHGVDIVAQIIERVPQLSVEKQVEVFLDLMPYVYPKRKAVEIIEPAKLEDNHITVNYVRAKDGKPAA